MKKDKLDHLIKNEHFPYLLIRDMLLTDILGEEAEDILYWSGKKLARQLQIENKEELYSLFTKCGLGILEQIETDKNKTIFHLTGDIVQTRLSNETASFQLEAGFLAEQLTLIENKPIEVQLKKLKKDGIQLIAT